MFKKVVLSSLLSVTMALSMAVPAGAEVSDRITRQDCKKFCKYTQNQEKQSIKKIKVQKKERNRSFRHVCELNKERYDELKKFIEKANFEEKEEYLKNLYSFYLAQEYGNLEAIDKNIRDQEHYTRALWQKYQEACPEVSCKGVYGNVTCASNISKAWNDFLQDYSIKEVMALIVGSTLGVGVGAVAAGGAEIVIELLQALGQYLKQ